MQVTAVLPALACFGQLEDELQGVVERAAEAFELHEELRSGDGDGVDGSCRVEVCGGHTETSLLLREEAGWEWDVGSAQRGSLRVMVRGASNGEGAPV